MAAAENGENEGVLGKVFGYTIDFMEELGRGGFGTVYKGHDGDQNALAIKKVSKKNKDRAIAETVRSHYFKDNINNDNIVRVHDVKTWKDSMWIFMEYCDLGDLADFFKNFNGIVQDVKTKLKLMLQISGGIAFLHANNIVHRDIKPGNILLKLSSTRHAIVKLGDFGLSKILDPDAVTSAMSSDVGTMIFKAPEFWDKKPPNDRVIYHRNIDIYAAGLTFTAMMQTVPGARSLVPKVEGSLQPSESKLPIGLAALSRNVNKHPSITVVVDQEKDCIVVRNIKKAIRGMTHITPQDRLSAGEVQQTCHALLDLTALNRCFGLPAEGLLNRMCFINSHLVLRGRCRRHCTFRAHDADSGRLTEEWDDVHCDHAQQQGCFTTLSLTHDGVTAEYLVEGCTRCRVIRMHNPSTKHASIVFTNVTPCNMCSGPASTLLVYDATTKCILHLLVTYNGGEFVQLKKLGPFSDESVVGMSYSTLSDIFVLIFEGMTTIMGIRLHTGRTVWQQCEGTLPYVSDVSSFPDGRICVTSGNSVFALDPTDGKILETLLEDEDLGGAWTIISSHNKLAVRHGHGSPSAEQISCYNIQQINSDPRIFTVFVPE